MIKLQIMRKIWKNAYLNLHNTSKPLNSPKKNWWQIYHPQNFHNHLKLTKTSTRSLLILQLAAKSTLLKWKSNKSKSSSYDPMVKRNRLSNHQKYQSHQHFKNLSIWRWWKFLRSKWKWMPFFHRQIKNKKCRNLLRNKKLKKSYCLKSKGWSNCKEKNKNWKMRSKSSS